MTTDSANSRNMEMNTFDQLFNYMDTVKIMINNYWLLLKDTVIQLWQYMEFRIMIYLFLALCFIPISIFVIFCSCLSSILFMISAGIWIFFGTIAFLILLPFLIGSLLISIGLVLVYRIYIILNNNDLNKKK
ncbi:uncharacterized protein BX664DRAFT_326284 [Halteromyces radiatus]|uniref:uncharacterized protein n=1 Tax=Halteromyces radiatus TaxID=101107 RepID=UPI00221E8829|nr:uncharacterized protein BX664DRAFT_326284 [Halteromyces radiatus]KAI8097396.1 hypothetical protein BX664DRAFT_326284 [Halteromyces radiatus]